MKMPLSAYLLLLLCICTGTAHAQSRKEADSILNATMNEYVKADEIFFDAIKAKNQEDPAHAKELFEQFVTRKPGVSAGYYELAKLYDAEKNTDKAQDNIKKAIAIDGENKWYQEEYASILAEVGDYLQAAGITARLCKSDPDDEEYPKMTAEYYERAQKYNDAIKYIDLALARTPDDEDLYMHKINVYLKNNDVDKAAAVAKDLIASDPYNGKYYKELGDIYDNNKMTGNATELYSKALKLLPDDPSVELGMAEHSLKLGDSAAYVTYVKKVIFNPTLDLPTQLDLMSGYLQTLPNDSLLRVAGLPLVRQLVSQHPADAQIMSIYGDFLDGNNKTDSAAWAYKLSLKINPSDFNIWKKLFNLYTDSKGGDSLIKYTEKAMKLFPNLAIVSYYNAIGHLGKKDYAGAVKSAKRAIDMEPENEKQAIADMYALLADIYHSSKQDDLSDNAFEQALKLDNNNSTTLNNYSYYLSERGAKLDEAEKMSKKSLELIEEAEKVSKSPADLKATEATYLDTYGWIQYKKGNYEQARGYIQKAIDLKTSAADAALYDHLGNIYYKLNDKSKAIQYWKISKEKGSDDPLIDKKISEEKLYE